MNHQMDHNMDHEMDPKMDHEMNHKMDHQMNHKMDHQMNHKMDYQMDQQMDTKKSPGLPPWLANLQPDHQTTSKISTSTSKSTTSNQPDWLANIFSSSSSSNSQTKSTTTTEEPFKMPDFANLKNQNRILNKDPMMKEQIPMVKINGPSITLPSFSLISDQLTLFPSSEDADAEQRTASIATDEQFD